MTTQKQWGESFMTELFADLNGHDDRGLYSALVEDADGPVSVGDAIRVVDDEGSVYRGYVADVEGQIISFSLEPGLTSRDRDDADLFALA